MLPVFRKCQRGMTLLECLMALAISSIILAGLSHTLGIALLSFNQNKQTFDQEREARLVMRRISLAIDAAYKKNKSELAAKDITRSGNWLDRYDEIKKQVVPIEYVWTATSGILTEKLGTAGTVALLANVSDFKVELVVTTTEIPLISVTLALAANGREIVLTETRRLGKSW